mmetsp:Transcript_16752/g.52373  ORF Transcript_16752/g.52373 Transcript_16752/m.52373 type:complete len:83 (-) Transcript_16752:1971-2219(-)
MVAVSNWADFEMIAGRIFAENPTKTRFVVKYRACDEQAVLKVTDNDKCIVFETNQANVILKMAKINEIFAGLSVTAQPAQTP